MTIEISAELHRKMKAAAASRGETLREFVSDAITMHIASTGSGWRSVFGLANPKTIKRIDALLETEFEEIDLSEWR